MLHIHCIPSHTLLYSLLMRYLFHNHCHRLKTHQCLLLFQDIRLHCSVLLSLLVQVYSCHFHCFQAVQVRYSPMRTLFHLPLMPMYGTLLLLLLLYPSNIDFLMLRLIPSVVCIGLRCCRFQEIHMHYVPMTIHFRLF